MGIKVAKFGGSSVAGPEQFQKVKAIIDADPERRVVISSAAGKRSGDDHKLTDLLYLVHAHLTYGVSCEEILHTIERRLYELRDSLGLQYEIEKDLDRLRSRLSRDLSVDELVSRGEYFTSRLLAEYLGFAFVDAADVIFFGLDGQVDREKTDAAIASALARHGKILIPGFYGRLPTGRIKVMSRGGSDITGALAAAAVGAEVYENWTDVSGILMADPRIVPDPNPIPHITFAELRELAFMGASVLHEDSIQPVKEKGIPLNIRNTNHPQDPGTMIVESIRDEERGERFITGIAGRKNFTIIKVLKRNMNQSATLRHALEILDRYHAPVEHITLGLDSFSLVASSAALGDGLELPPGRRADPGRHRPGGLGGPPDGLAARHLRPALRGPGRGGGQHPYHRPGRRRAEHYRGRAERAVRNRDPRPLRRLHRLIRKYPFPLSRKCLSHQSRTRRNPS